MPFIPHTESDIQLMLQEIGVESINSLFDEIPSALMINDMPEIPMGLNEMAMMQLMQSRAKQTMELQCFIGAGAYEHHIPAAVWDLTQRGEFLTAYTPYQAEASQGSLQLMWEYQTMMASLMGMEISNASLYDGASALAEAVLMGIRSKSKEVKPCVWIASNIHPFYRQVLHTILKPHAIPVKEIAYDPTHGVVTLEALETQWQQEKSLTVLVMGQPNFFGRLENVDTITDWAHEKDAVVVGVVNPIAMSWLKPPGQWGKSGADIACGEGQPLGVPLAGGGPYFGFLCSRMSLVRQMPGRLVGLTQDQNNQPGFTLTLQAREQHIRRSKATSNICTNQGLLVTAATIYMSLLGPQGLKQIAQQCYLNHQVLVQQLLAIDVKPCFVGEHFHESVWQLPADVNKVLETLCEQGIAGGFNVSPYYPSLENALLICATETKSSEDIEHFVKMLNAAIQRSHI
ncbi:aminomethyl-transferring glycine dehydrogenase subunit GcvPA [Candidatus Berkiella aquae]|uniref:Probable glycine dehydrogenase (decarboxylating) subunit 1 n=1 Tax=Candidatus Berkiella aquae TaxID=295108 RepID=A0A0Q9YN69_9GAMM|nr:aminomethyl-transferring glycine dehydrogenase subunit GcvPA [Candidatus Berkiella aquae]MCS5712562.1 aminomethyl-transferring glycine dehydrogenase subunit GcvPA [Candidatus Berkiella aquae]